MPVLECSGRWYLQTAKDDSLAIRYPWNRNKSSFTTEFPFKYYMIANELIRYKKQENGRHVFIFPT